MSKIFIFIYVNILVIMLILLVLRISNYRLQDVKNKSSDCWIRPFPASVNGLTVPRLRPWRWQGSHSTETWTQYAVQPTQCIKQFSTWYCKTFRKKSRKLFRGRDLIVVKLKPHVSLAGSSTSKTKISRGQDTHSLSMYQIWGLYIIFKAMKADKWLWSNLAAK